MPKMLVAFDTDRIKQYVFRTPTLKEIRGASSLLDRLNCSDMPRLVRGRKIYANGGGGLFVVDSADAKRARQEVERLYRTETHSATITSAAVELPDDPKALKGALDSVRRQLRANKTGQHAIELPVSHPLFRFCEVCGIQYAQVQQEDAHLCLSCKAKRNENGDVHHEITRWLHEGARPDRGRLWGRLIGNLQEREYPISGFNRPDTFEDLGNLSSDYMGLIYADGDGMGRIIESIDDLDVLERFSRIVEESVADAVADAVKAHLPPKRGRLPFDVLLLGGDDLVMVTTAPQAAATAAAIVERFAELTRTKWGTPLSLSASVTLTHVSYPIGSLIHLAESGLKFAKREAAQRRLPSKAAGGSAGASARTQAQTGGLINFVVVNSPNHVEFNKYYRETLRTVEGGEVISRTMRPYTAAELQALLEKVRRAQKAPRAKLEQLRAAVFKSRRQATLDAMKATLRLRNAAQRDAIFELMGAEDKEQINLPWVPRAGGGWTTPVLDVVELLDFVE